MNRKAMILTYLLLISSFILSACIGLLPLEIKTVKGTMRGINSYSFLIR